MTKGLNLNWLPGDIAYDQIDFDATAITNNFFFSLGTEQDILAGVNVCYVRG